MHLTIEQVAEMAPDASSAAGKNLMALKNWPELGRSNRAGESAHVRQVNFDPVDGAPLVGISRPSTCLQGNVRLGQLQGAPSFTCSPFPTLMATAIQQRDIVAWAAGHDVVIRGGGGAE